MRRASKPTATLVVEAYCPLCERSFPEALECCPDDGARLVRLTQKEVDLVGRTFDGRFEIKGLLGDGGMGAVYRAVETKGKREVAIKVIRAELTNDIGVAKRFLREARVTSGFDHPNTVTVYDYGQTSDGILFLTMELLDGLTLEEAAQKHGPMPPGRVAHIACQIFDALDVAHRQAVVHRDLKPSNIMLTKGKEGRDMVKVLDFGLAKSLGSDQNTTAGFLMGTPAYLAPEIILRGDVKFSSDLYAVGVLLFEVLTGHVPFQDEEIPAVLMAHAHRPPPSLPSHVPVALARFVMRLLAKDPSERFKSAHNAGRALAVVMEDFTDTHTDVDKVGNDTHDSGTLPGFGAWSADDEPRTLRGSDFVNSDVFDSDRVTAPQKVLENEEKSSTTPLGKGGRPRCTRSFFTTKTKLLTPVPPVHTIEAEILNSGNEEVITAEMAKLMVPDTDRMSAEPDPDTDKTSAVTADTDEFVVAEEPRAVGGKLPVAPPVASTTDDPLEYSRTNRMPVQRRLSSTPIPEFDSPAALSTAVVERGSARRGRSGDKAASAGAPSLIWAVGLALLGVGAGVLAWVLLGS